MGPGELNKRAELRELDDWATLDREEQYEKIDYAVPRADWVRGRG